MLLARLKEQYQKLVLLKRRNEEMLEIVHSILTQKQVMAEATVSTHHGVKEHGSREFKFPLLIIYTEPNQNVRVFLLFRCGLRLKEISLRRWMRMRRWKTKIRRRMGKMMRRLRCRKRKEYVILVKIMIKNYKNSGRNKLSG